MSSIRRTGYGNDSGDMAAATETLRAAADHPQPRVAKSDDEKMSLFWRVFGGTIVSVCALIGLTIYNNTMGTVNDLRSEVNRLTEAKADAAKKDDLNALRTQVSGHAEYRREIDSLKERAGKHRAEIDEVKKELTTAVDGVRKELAGQFETVRKEQAATTDALKKDVAAMELLRERLTMLAADLKTARDDTQKLRQDVDKNQTYDFERRDRRDVQMKQFDETLKDIQKNLLETREKVARLEGQTQAKPATTPVAAEVVGPPASGKGK